LFLEHVVDKNAAKELGYGSAEEAFVAKADDHRVPRGESLVKGR
jgi:hypothetical protein